MPRTRAPAGLKLLTGVRAGRDSGGRPVQLPPAFRRVPPEPPEWLDEVARGEWDRVVPELARLDVLKAVDGSALAAYCEMVSLFVRATAEVHAGGLTVQNRTVRRDGTESVWYTANPAVSVQRNAQAAMRGWAAHFGLTPSSEQAIGRPPADDDDADNPFAGRPA